MASAKDGADVILRPPKRKTGWLILGTAAALGLAAEAVAMGFGDGWRDWWYLVAAAAGPPLLLDAIAWGFYGRKGNIRPVGVLAVLSLCLSIPGLLIFAYLLLLLWQFTR